MKILHFSLKSALDEYEAKTGLHLGYEELSEMTEISLDTLKSVSSRKKYNVTFQTVGTVCNALNVNPLEHLEWLDEPC